MAMALPLIALTSLPAQADTETTPSATGVQFTTNAHNASSAGSGSRPSPSNVAGTSPAPASGAQECNASYGCVAPQRCPEGSTPYFGPGIDSNGQQVGSYFTCAESPTAAPSAPAITPADVAKAFQATPVPDTPLTVQPPGGETLVNYDTVYLTHAQPFDAAFTLLGQNVVLHITPATFTWTHGDGTTQTSTHPGRSWTDADSLAHAKRQPVSSTLVTHRYRTKATVDATLTTTWTATWDLNGTPQGTVPGTVQKTTAPTTLTVLEARPALVP